MVKLRWRQIPAALAALLILTGCGAPGGGARETAAAQTVPETVISARTEAPKVTSPVLADILPTAEATTVPTGGYRAPEFHDSYFDEAAAQDCGKLRVDYSGAPKGYVAVSAVSGKRLKLQVVAANMKYNYDVPGDGTPAVVPLNLGSGSYTFRLMENVGGSKYSCSWSDTKKVELEDEFQPYLRPSVMVNYTRDSQCVALAREMAGQCDSDTELAAMVYDYMVRNIAYDHEEAATVQPGYLPDPDEVLQTGKGICFDYAALAAAMLRSQGIPCQLITGYVKNSTYHAWNTFYLEGQGWITAEIRASTDTWQRVDITFAAAGVTADKLTNDSLYTTRYTY